MTPQYPSARDTLNALERGETTSRALTTAYLERITAEPKINAVVTTDSERALAAADAADERRSRGKPGGPLLGLPMTVKDSLETAGLRTTSGGALADHVPAADADAVALLRAAGAIIIGKTNTPPMCQDIQTSNDLFGTTPNPYDAARTAGGSSGGPAAAVAAGLTPLEVGSDLAGSLRLPAHYCGVYGLRTTRGIVPTRGHVPRPPGWMTSSDMLTIGPLARSAEDLDLALDVLAGPSPADSPGWSLQLPAARHTSLADLRIGIWADDPYCPVDTDTRHLLEQVATSLRAAGASLDEHSRPIDDFADSDRLFQQLMFATSSATAGQEEFDGQTRSAEQLPDDHPAALFLRSRTMRHRDWLRAHEEREQLRERWAAYFRTVDVLITPAAPTAAVADQTGVPPTERYFTVDGERRSFFGQTAWLNLVSHVGLPAAVAPMGRDRDGMPLGVQIIGPHLADRTVVAVAGQLAAEAA
ncbi:amidase [Streptomyces sp. NPDC021093]|uniref:amidase n=1 Tax=Streptomyces sp. NPDC021093 TaxID=3365112 RepID=UPI003790300C